MKYTHYQLMSVLRDIYQHSQFTTTFVHVLLGDPTGVVTGMVNGDSWLS